MKLLRSLAFFGSQANKTKAYQTYNFARDIPESYERTHWNLFSAVNSAIDLALESDPRYSFNNQAQKCSVKTLSLEECLGALQAYVNAMVLIESSIHLYQSKELLDLLLDWQSPDTPLLRKFNSEIISFLLLIR